MLFDRTVSEKMTAFRLIHMLLLILLVTFQASCIKRHSNTNVAPGSDNKSANSNLGIKDYKEFELFNPEMAKVTVSAMELDVKDFGDDLFLPGFGIQFNGNDYVMILRCQDSYREALENLINQADQGNPEDRKWVWADSVGNPRACKIASQRFNGREFQDLGAKNGKIFYLVNPCVSASISTTRRDTCSYHLSVTNSVEYHQSPSNLFLQKAAELSDAESAYDAHISRLMGLSRELMNQKNACEFGITHADSRANIKSFGWDLISAGIAVAGVLAVRGMLRKAGDAAASTGSNAFKRYVLKMGNTADYLKKLSIDKNINNATLITAGIFSAALAIRGIIKRLRSSGQDSSGVAACTQADRVAQEIVSIQESNVVEIAMNQMIQISKELTALDARFQGYSESTFKVNTL